MFRPAPVNQPREALPVRNSLTYLLLPLAAGALTVLPATPGSAQDQDAPPPIPAVELSDPSKLATDGDAAWNKGDWLTAAANYAGLLEIAKKTDSVPPAQLQELYYFLGAACFNIPHYDKALEIFNESLTRFPNGKYAFEAKLGTARALRAQKKYAEAVQKYEALRNPPAVYRDDVLIEHAATLAENEQPDRAIALLAPEVAKGIRTEGEVRSALFLVDLYSEKDPDKGVAVLEKVKSSPGARAMVMEINYMALKTADALMREEKYESALVAYQNLRRKKEVVAILKDLVTAYEQRVKRLQAGIAAKAGNAAVLAASLDRTKLSLSQATAQLGELEKQANYDAVVVYRIGRCFAQLGRYWEARLALDWVYNTFPEFEDRPVVLYTLAFCLFQLSPQSAEQDGMKLLSRTAGICREYLKQYSDGERAGEIAEMLIATEQRFNDSARTAAAMDEVMQYLANSPNKDRFLAIQVQSYLEQFQPAKAREAADRFLAQAAKESPLLEDVKYMRALTFFFDNDYKGSLDALQEYDSEFPNGRYRAEALYRIAMIMKGEELAKKAKGGETDLLGVIRKCEYVIATFPDSPSAGDCQALIGDCYAVMPGDEMARKGLTAEEVDRRMADAYTAAVRRGATEEVVEYSLTQLRPILVRNDRWKDIEAIYREFHEAHPDHRLALEAISWIGKAMVRQAKTPGEREAAEARSRQFLAETILENIDNPQKDGVEELLLELARASRPKRRATPPPAADPAAAEKSAEGPVATAPAQTRAPAPSAAEQGAQAEAEMDRLLTPPSGEAHSRIAQARILYAKSLLYQTLRGPGTRLPDGRVVRDDSGQKKSDELMERLVTEFTPDDFSPRILAVAGDYYLGRGLEDNAAACFNRLVQFYPQSMFVDWGSVGLGELALKDGDAELALKRFSAAIDEFPGMKYGEALLGKGRALYQLGQYNEAEKTLKEVFEDRTYPVEVKAEVTALLGEVRFQLKDYAGAFQYFQRLYLSFKTPKWLVRGYLRAGEMKEAMGKPADALEVYREARDTPRIREKIRNEPEYPKIEERLRILGA